MVCPDQNARANEIRKDLAEAARAHRDGVVPAYLLVNHARLLVSLHRGDEALAQLERARNQGELPPAIAGAPG